MKSYVTGLLILASLGIFWIGCRQDQTRNYLTESKSDFDQRMDWWRDAGVGMFIHWGLYSVPAGEYNGDTSHAEWIQETADIPVAEYEKFAQQFNPVQFNAEHWVQLAKDAGMKYIVITSKHHDGFCLWDSKVSDYDVMDRTPFQRDILKELSEACKKSDIRLCFYHSIMDWHHPDAQGGNHPDYNYGQGPNPNFNRYVETYLKPQLKELVQNYGPLGVLWFDGEWINEWTEEMGKDLYYYVRSLQPDIIINNRVGKARDGMQGMNSYENAAGDFGTPEQEILTGKSAMDWESCMTMNDHWGYNKFDQNFKSAQTLIHNLIDIAAKGGNYLLNVGPTPEGLIPPPSVERLQEIGAWMRVNAEAIHASHSLENYRETETLYFTRSKDNRYIYAIATQWPGTELKMHYVRPKAESRISLLGFDQPLAWESDANAGLTIRIPETLQNETNRPGRHAYVFKIEGDPAPVAAVPTFGTAEKPQQGRTIFADSMEVVLRSNTAGAAIHYSLDGSEPSTISPRYDEPIRLTASAHIRARSFHDGMVNSPIASAEFLKTSQIKSIRYRHPFSSQYAGLGELTLADGELGSTRFDDGKWLGFEQVDFQAVLDLGQMRSVQKISCGFLQDLNVWIFLPTQVSFAVSSDGSNFANVGDKTFTPDPNDKTARIETCTVDFSPRTARFVQVQAKNIGLCPPWHKGAGGKAWVFVDEVVVE